MPCAVSSPSSSVHYPATAAAPPSQPTCSYPPPPPSRASHPSSRLAPAHVGNSTPPPSPPSGKALLSEGLEAPLSNHCSLPHSRPAVHSVAGAASAARRRQLSRGAQRRRNKSTTMTRRWWSSWSCCGCGTLCTHISSARVSSHWRDRSEGAYEDAGSRTAYQVFRG